MKQKKNYTGEPSDYTDYLVVKRSKPGAGLGLFTLVPIKKGEFVIEYTGKRISTSDADGLDTKYLFEVDKKVTIDGAGREHLARYINHSCSPNCEAEIYTPEKQVFIYAKRNIKAGEELSYDYGKEYYDEFIKPHGCKCGAKKHRG